MLRILICTDDDLSELDSAAEAKGRLQWIVPKDAEPGEPCLFSHMGEGITHIGELRSNAIRNDEPPWKGRYSASVHRLAILDQPVRHEQLAEQFPDWKWLTYPRTYTSVDGPLAERLLDICADGTAPGLYDIDEVVASEGKLYLRRHLVRERNLAIVQAKRKQVLAATNRLACEVCSFDFQEAYGDVGRGFCEVHHTRPMAARYEDEETRLQDLVVVCSNCHRMLHRRGLLSIEELKSACRDGSAGAKQSRAPFGAHRAPRTSRVQTA